MPEVFKIDKKGKLGLDNVKPHIVVDKRAKRPPFAKFCPPN